MKVGTQSTLNDLQQLENKTSLVEGTANQALSAANQALSNLGQNGNVVYGLIISEDFYTLRETGVYKVQNNTDTQNPNRPPIDDWGTGLYGTLVVFKAETGGEGRTVMEFSSSEGDRYFCLHNGDSWSAWRVIYSSANTIVDANGFLKTA